MKLIQLILCAFCICAAIYFQMKHEMLDAIYCLCFAILYKLIFEDKE